MTRRKTKVIRIRNIPIGGDHPIAIQSMTFSKTCDIQSTLEQINRLALAGCHLVRVAVSDENDAQALQSLVSRSPLPIIADIHFRYKLALIAAQSVDAIRINPGNIGSKDRIKAVVEACKERRIPIRIGVNAGSLEKQFDEKYGATPKGMVESALYNIKLLEDFGFEDIKISLKASDVIRTIEAYRLLAKEDLPYPLHLGVTEAGTLEHSVIKSSMALGNLLLDGIGDTVRVSITGELEEEVNVARNILRYSKRLQEGVTIISCPTCGRIEADLVSAVKEVQKRLAHIKTPLQVSVMGCAVNALGEAKHADIAIAFGNRDGLIIKEGKILCKLKEDQILDVFVSEVEAMASQKRN